MILMQYPSYYWAWGDNDVSDKLGLWREEDGVTFEQLPVMYSTSYSPRSDLKLLPLYENTLAESNADEWRRIRN